MPRKSKATSLLGTATLHPLGERICTIAGTVGFWEGSVFELSTQFVPMEGLVAPQTACMDIFALKGKKEQECLWGKGGGVKG